MTYRQLFDHLGNPVAKPARQHIGHRIIQTASVICMLVMLAVLYGGRS